MPTTWDLKTKWFGGIFCTALKNVRTLHGPEFIAKTTKIDIKPTKIFASKKRSQCNAIAKIYTPSYFSSKMSRLGKISNNFHWSGKLNHSHPRHTVIRANTDVKEQTTTPHLNDSTYMYQHQQYYAVNTWEINIALQVNFQYLECMPINMRRFSQHITAHFILASNFAIRAFKQ